MDREWTASTPPTGHFTFQVETLGLIWMIFTLSTHVTLRPTLFQFFHLSLLPALLRLV